MSCDSPDLRLRRSVEPTTRCGLLAGATLLVGLGGCPGCDGEIRLGQDLAQDGGAGASRADPGAPSAPCSRDGECGVASLHCDVVSASCVACAADDHCTRDDLRRCDGATHRCVECGLNADCASPGFVCEPMTRKCVPSCTGETQCPESAQTCDVGRAVCVACTVDASCSSGDRSHCENGSGRCVECTDDAHCGGEKPRCVRETGRCVECVSAADCSSDEPICDAASWSCRHTDP